MPKKVSEVRVTGHSLILTCTHVALEGEIYIPEKLKNGDILYRKGHSKVSD